MSQNKAVKSNLVELSQDDLNGVNAGYSYSYSSSSSSSSSNGQSNGSYSSIQVVNGQIVSQEQYSW
jgi:hypothetical protein